MTEIKMWDLSKFACYSQQNYLKPAIIHFETANHHTLLSFKETLELASEYKTLLKKFIPHSQQCIGLFMDFNPYIPALILSLLNDHSFIFLDPDSSDNDRIISRLQIRWIITYDHKSSNQINNLKCVTILSEKIKLNTISCNFSESYSYNDIVYVISTSGTTGKPKTVRVRSSCISSNIESLRNIFDVKEDDIVFFGTPLTFDPSVVELFFGLTFGCTLVSIQSKFKLNPPLLYEILFSPKERVHNGVTFLQTVPSMFLRWSRSTIQNILCHSTLKVLALGGEKFPESLLSYDRSEKLRIFNLYGITEVSCWASVCEIKNDSEVTLGSPLQETIIEVRNNQRERIVEGEGDLFIGSNTRICLIDNEPEDLQTPVFRATGDVVKITDNNLIYIGRKDSIIKRYGNKVSLTKIEEIAFQETGLNSIAIWSDKEQKLIMFVTIRKMNFTHKYKIKDKVRRKLIHALPKELFPDDIDIVPVFPTTSNGKINKDALLKMYTFQKTKPSQENMYEFFKNLWAKYLGIDIKSVDELSDFSFKDLGGTSFSFIQFLNELNETIKVPIPEQLHDLLLNNSFKGCYDYIKKNSSEFRKRKIDGNNSEGRLPKITRLNGEIDLNLKWRYDLKGCVFSSPLVITDSKRTLVLCASFYQIFATIDLETGESVSETVLPDSLQGGICARGLDKAYIGCNNGCMYCIDILKGDHKWHFQTNYEAFTSKPCFCLQNEAIVFGSYDGHVYCLSAEEGKLIWKTYLGHYSPISANPVYSDKFKKVYIGSSNTTCCCLNEEDGSITWSYKLDTPLMGSPCLMVCRNEECILWPEVGGMVHCTTCEKGEKLWTFKVEGHIYSSVVSYSDYFLFGCEDHDVYCVKISDENCSLHFKISLGSKITPTPCVFEYKDLTYIFAAANNGTVCLIDFEKKSIVQEIKMQDEVFCSPCAYKDYLLVGSNDNHLYCFSLQS